MKPRLWSHEVRRVGMPALAAPVAVLLGLAAAGGLLAAMNVGHDRLQLWLGIGLEMAAPLAASLPVAWIVARESAIELQLSVPTPYAGTVLRRLAIAAAWSALLCLAIADALWAPGWWHLRGGFWLAQLTWLSPLLWLVAAAALAAVVLRSATATGGLIAVVWLLEIITVGAFLSNRWLRQVHLFATTFAGPAAPFWRSNRLTLLVLALLMLAAAWLLLQRSELLLSGADET